MKRKDTKSGNLRRRPQAGRESNADAVVSELRRIVLAVDASIREGVKWNAPSFYTSEHFATVNARGKDGLRLVLHLGARPRHDVDLREEISTVPGLLEWKGHDRAIVSLTDAADVRHKAAALTRVLRQWIAHVR